MFNRRFFFAAIGLALLTACDSFERSVVRDSWPIRKPDEATVAVPLSVETVETFGFWSKGEREGNYRLVLLQKGYEHLSHRLFIEWIGLSRTSERILVERIEPDLGLGTSPAGHAIAVTRIESYESGGATVHLDTVHPVTMERRSVTLKIGEPGVCESF